MNEEVIPITIKGVMPTAGGCAVFLGTEHKTFVIHMDATMGNAITMHLQHVHAQRPLTHDLIKEIFLGFGTTLEHITINDVKDATFFSRIILTMRNELGTKVIELDARPSDAIVLALQAQKTIFIAKRIFEQIEDISHLLSKLIEENEQKEDEDDENENSK